jgi:hypothetical protein
MFSMSSARVVATCAKIVAMGTENVVFFPIAAFATQI